MRLSNLMAYAARAEGTWGCSPDLFPEVLDLVLSGKVAIDPFVEFHPMSAINEIFDSLRHHALKKRPVLLLGCGESGVRFCPPLCISAAQVETALVLMREVIRPLAA